MTTDAPSTGSLRSTPLQVWTAAGWVPAGFAATRFVQDGTPLVAVVCLATLAAGVHRATPGVVEVVGGSGGFLLGLFAAVDSRGCGPILDTPAVGVVLVYGSVMVVSAFVRLLGSGNGREMARHLLVATAAIELSLFLASSRGQALVGRHDQPVVLAMGLLVATLIGTQAHHGFIFLGTALLGSLTWFAATDAPCLTNPTIALVGSVTFAMAVFWSGGRRRADVGNSWP